MDDYSNFLWSFLLRNKSHISSTLLPILHQLQQQRELKVKYLRCESAPEYLKFQKSLQQTTDLKIQFEYTASDTTQQNGKIKCKFTTLYGKTRAMMNQAEFTFNPNYTIMASLSSIWVPHLITPIMSTFSGILKPRHSFIWNHITKAQFCSRHAVFLPDTFSVY
jgi:hypothetical protein